VSLARKAVRGATWNIVSGIAARFISVVATLGLTHLLAPDQIGEVAVAVVLVQSANQFSSLGFGQFVVVNPNLPPTSVFQVAALHLAFGVAALILVTALAGPLAGPFEVPNLADYVPGMALAVLISRLAVIPERVLVREMRFAPGANARALGEVSYGAVAVALAALDWGGQAIVIGNIARSVVFTAVILRASDSSAWLRPHRLQRDLCRRVFHFGTPLWLGASASFFSGKWDSVLYASLFGPAHAGYYTLAYSLADIPTQQVGEHIGDVLVPSFTRLDESAQRHALVRAAALLALIVFPLAVGLGATAKTLVALLFDENWQDLAMFVAILSALSVARPIGAVIQSLLQARQQTRAVMILEIGKLAAVLGSIAALSLLGPLWAASGVGIAFGLHALASMWFVDASIGVPMRRMLGAVVGPLVACVPMFGAVLAVRHGLDLTERAPVAGLVLEILAGALVYCGSALVLCRSHTADFFGLLRKSFRARGAG
jgi:PST family polysaccharide transporter